MEGRTLLTSGFISGGRLNRKIFLWKKFLLFALATAGFSSVMRYGRSGVVSRPALRTRTQQQDSAFSQKKNEYHSIINDAVDSYPRQGQKPSKGIFWKYRSRQDPFVILQAPPRAKSIAELPVSWDWRNVNGTGLSLITSVGNQMLPHGCGSCWAFAVTRALSDRIKILQWKKYGHISVETVLSVQALLDCGTVDEFGSCHGGDPRYAHEWIYKNGLVDQTCSPYVAASPSWFTESESCADAQCHMCSISGECQIVPNPKKIYLAEYDTFNSGVDDTDSFLLEVMSEVYFRGPVVLSMYAHSSEFENFKGGYILRDRTHYAGTTHDVSVIGWGTEGGVKYWIIRNSFGTEWGENGFFRVEQGINAYNLETQGAWGVPKIP